MSELIQAIFEGGVLRPLEPVSLQEHELVSVSIQRAARPTASESTETMTVEQKQAIVALLDQMERMPERSPADGFSNRDHDQIIYGPSK